LATAVPRGHIQTKAVFLLGFCGLAVCVRDGGIDNNGQGEVTDLSD
jgi:hypothetical protein